MRAAGWVALVAAVAMSGGAMAQSAYSSGSVSGTSGPANGPGTGTIGSDRTGPVPPAPPLGAVEGPPTTGSTVIITEPAPGYAPGATRTEPGGVVIVPR